MKPLLKNPVYNSLLSGDRHLGFGSETVRCFYEDVSPLAGFKEGYSDGFSELYDLLPAGRTILYATPLPLTAPKGWTVVQETEGFQFVYEKSSIKEPEAFFPVPLQQEHIEQMMELAALTKPGPFGSRTIEFGHYHGVFENGQLVAMTGQRLHVENYTEISAVCTHPDHLGKGYATALVQHSAALILSGGKIPFLHVRQDNQRAIDVYKRLGFTMQGSMNFYTLEREGIVI